MSGLISPVMRNGFPFPIWELAEDGQPFEIWDGTTFSSEDPPPLMMTPLAGGRPSKESDSYVTVVGNGTMYPVGFTLEKFTEFFYRNKVMVFNCYATYPAEDITGLYELNCGVPVVSGQYSWYQVLAPTPEDEINTSTLSDSCLPQAETGLLFSSSYFPGDNWHLKSGSFSFQNYYDPVEPLPPQGAPPSGSAVSSNYPSGVLDPLAYLDQEVLPPWRHEASITMRVGLTVKSGDLYYPRILIEGHFEPDYAYRGIQDFTPSNICYEGFTAHGNATILGHEVGLFSNADFFIQDDSLMIASLVPSKYWSYDGRWNTTTGAWEGTGA